MACQQRSQKSKVLVFVENRCFLKTTDLILHTFVQTPFKSIWAKDYHCISHSLVYLFLSNAALFQILILQNGTGRNGFLHAMQPSTMLPCGWSQISPLPHDKHCLEKLSANLNFAFLTQSASRGYISDFAGIWAWTAFWQMKHERVSWQSAMFHLRHQKTLRVLLPIIKD